MTIVAPAGLAVDRLIVVGIGGEKDRAKVDFVQLGGFVAGKHGRQAARRWFVDLPGRRPIAPEGAGRSGPRRAPARLQLRPLQDQEGRRRRPRAAGRSSSASRIAAAVKKAYKARDGARRQGVIIARDLVNEPPNVLGPVEFAARAEALTQARRRGRDPRREGDGEARHAGAPRRRRRAPSAESRVVDHALERRQGRRTSPIAFIGKGVVFDSGGISIKPGGGMEDMKGDMAGAACVVGLMHALASRKAKANVVGAIGLVENMPDGNAQRPGDIVTTMSGQTIEIINTDAEGRLVLADVLWYVQDRFKPKFMIDLATLTGAIIVALAQEYAGLFSNNDELAERLSAAGRATGERVWRMPLGPEYDKMIESKFADMKNIGRPPRRLDHGGGLPAAVRQRRALGASRHRRHRPWARRRARSTGAGARAGACASSTGWCGSITRR